MFKLKEIGKNTNEDRIQINKSAFLQWTCDDFAPWIDNNQFLLKALKVVCWLSVFDSYFLNLSM
jgi:hypothetical protein